MPNEHQRMNPRRKKIKGCTPENGHPPTILWTWTLTMAHVKKGNRCSPKETHLHQIPGKDEPQRMFLKGNHIRPQAHAGDVQSVKEQQQSRNVCGDTLLWWWWFVCRGRLINVTSSDLSVPMRDGSETIRTEHLLNRPYLKHSVFRTKCVLRKA